MMTSTRHRINIAFLFLILLCGLQSIPAGETAGLGPGEKRKLSDVEYRAFVSALGLPAKPGWRADLESEALKVRLLSRQARLSNDQIRRIGLSAKGRSDRRLIGRWRQQVVAAIDLEPFENDAIEAEIAADIELPKKWLLWNISLRLSQEGSSSERDELRSKLNTIRSAVIAGADFAEQARRFSHSSSRYRGGKIGWTRLDRLSPEMQSLVGALSAGQYSEIVDSSGGVAFYYVDKIKKPRTVMRSIQVERLARKRVEKKRRAAWQKILDRADADAAQKLAEVSVFEESGDATQALLRVGNKSLDLRDLRHWSGAKAAAAETGVSTETRELALAYLRSDLLVVGAVRQGVEPNLPERAWLTDYFRAQTELTYRATRQVTPIDAAAVADYYREHQGDYVEGQKWVSSMIEFRFTSQNQRQIKLLAERTLREIQDGEITFADAARNYSVGPFAQDGGFLGERGGGEFKFLDGVALYVLKAMQPGGLEGPVPGDRKMVLLTLHRSIPARQKGLSEVKGEIQHLLWERAVEAAQDKILAAF